MSFIKKYFNKNYPSLQPVMEMIMCFSNNTFNLLEVVDLVEETNEFSIAYVELNNEKQEFTSIIKDQLRNLSPESIELLMIQGVSFVDKDQNTSIFIHQAPNLGKTQTLYWSTNSQSLLDPQPFNRMLTSKKFIAGFCHNKEDTFLQNSSILAYYEQKGIKPFKTKKNWIGQVEVDIDANPGRKFLLRDTWVMSSWKMWFGRKFYSFLPKEELLNFKDCEWNIDLHDCVYIQLYKDGDKPFLAKNRDRQQNFLNWVNIHQLLKQYPPY